MSYSGNLFDFEDASKSDPEPIPKRPVKRAEKIIATSPAEELPVSREPLSVSTLTLQIKDVLTGESFRDIRVTGQISNLSQPYSGHIYLTLKDDGAQLPAVVWKSAAAKVRFKVKDGMEVLCRGRLDVYPPQGKYQLVVTEMEEKGLGTLEAAFRRLHEKLAAEGLFEPSRKKPLPRSIRRVAVVTSASGAAIRDFLQVLGRRTRRIDVLLVPVRVQGDGAAAEVAQAIQWVHAIRETQPVDVIVVTRGGGSTEDLWAFNEEVLVRAVAASAIPVVSGVGHEIDVTLCDLAADVRALTPSEAAERIAPEDAELRRGLQQYRTKINDLLRRRLQACEDRLRRFETHPSLARPERLVENRRQTVDWLEERLNHTMDRRTQDARQSLARLAATLQALSPLAILARGYSLTTTEDDRPLRSVTEIASGDHIRTRLADGTFESVVIQTTTPVPR